MTNGTTKATNKTETTMKTLKTNRFPTDCVDCGCRVEADHGALVRDDNNRWAASCRKARIASLKTGKVEECDRCRGTGTYRWGCQTHELGGGVRSAHSGTCFRCGGKGTQNDEDRVRNYFHDLRYLAEAAR